MARVPTSNYNADVDTGFQWATVDGDFFDRELDISFLARALERHDHSTGRGVAVARLASASIISAWFAPGSVDTAALGALQVTTSKIANNAVDNTKLAAGVAVTNLGFTPVNRAGDTGLTGPYQIVNSLLGQPCFILKHTGIGATGYSLGILNADSSNWEVLIGHTSFSVSIPAAFTSGMLLSGSVTINGGVPWTNLNDGAGSGLDADLGDGRGFGNATQEIPISNGVLCTNLNAQFLNGLTSAAFATPASVAAAVAAVNSVPSGAVVWFRTAAELTAAGAGWTTETLLAGRVPIGAGTTFSQTFTENTSYGSNWTPFAGVSGFTGTAADVLNVQSGSGSSVSAPSHQNALSIPAQTWVIPSRAGVFGRKL